MLESVSSGEMGYSVVRIPIDKKYQNYPGHSAATVTSIRSRLPHEISESLASQSVIHEERYWSLDQKKLAKPETFAGRTKACRDIRRANEVTGAMHPSQLLFGIDIVVQVTLLVRKALYEQCQRELGINHALVRIRWQLR